MERRIGVLRPQLERIKADIICFQEINGQERAFSRGRIDYFITEHEEEARDWVEKKLIR